jgi:predicted small lipoprotein YifL
LQGFGIEYVVENSGSRQPAKQSPNGGLKMSTIRKFMVMSFAIALIFAFTACEKEGPMERAGKKADEAIEKTEKKVEEAAEAVKQKTE